MTDKTDFQYFIQKILHQAEELLDADGGAIYVLENDQLLLQASSGELHDVKPRQGGLTREIVNFGSAIILPEANRQSLRDNELKSPNIGIRSLLGAPIISNSTVVGVIMLARSASREQDFTSTEVRLLDIFAKTAAAAIEARQQLSIALEAPYVFVLMPFNEAFDDVYELGINAVAKHLGMRCNRVDNIEFNDSILMRIYNEIQRSDIVIADMSGRNPNVFYEVGYAHALQKDVVLLTQQVDDIPFDLKGYNHIVYQGKVTLLRELLETRLKAWLRESRFIENA